MAVHDLARIEEKLDRVAVGNTAVSETMGGLSFSTMSEVIEFAKLMSLSGNAVPKHLQGNPGMCLAVCVQAMEWRFSPFSVANKSYEVQNRLCFESQLVHAVIEQRAPIIGRLSHRFDGEDGQRRCIVSAKLRETGETLEYISPPFDKIQPKNSPLWKTKPDLQLYYNTSRDFCRAYFPDVLLGVYSAEELRDHVGPDNAKDVSKPDVASRLKAKGARGFNASHVERESRGGVVDESTTSKGGAGHSENPQHPTNAQDEKPVDQTTAGAETGQAGETPATESQPSDLLQDQMQPAADSSAPNPTVAGDLSESSPPSPGDEAGGDLGLAASSPSAPEVSSLSDDWRDVYLTAMARASDRPKSLPTRHTEAIQMIGGEPNESEREWMRAVYRLTQRRLRGEISKDDCEAAIREIS